MCNLYLLFSLILEQILYALGNNRPPALLEVERDLCNCIMRVMSGSDAVTQLKRFLEDYDERTHVWAANGTDLGLDFFDNGRTCCHVNFNQSTADLSLPALNTQSQLDVNQAPIDPPPPSLLPTPLPPPLSCLSLSRLSWSRLSLCCLSLSLLSWSCLSLSHLSWSRLSLSHLYNRSPFPHMHHLSQLHLPYPPIREQLLICP
jgi:hypothetical protein